MYQRPKSDPLNTQSWDHKCCYDFPNTCKVATFIWFCLREHITELYLWWEKSSFWLFIIIIAIAILILEKWSTALIRLLSFLLSFAIFRPRTYKYSSVSFLAAYIFLSLWWWILLKNRKFTIYYTLKDKKIQLRKHCYKSFIPILKSIQIPK